MRAIPGLGGALTGALLFVASPGVDVWPAAFVALVPLMLVIERASLLRALFEGTVGGICLFAPGMSWLPEFFGFASGVTPAFVWSAYGAIVLLSSVKLCAACGVAWLLLRAGVNRILAFACSFAAGELAVPGLVPYTISASLHPVSPLLQVAELGGAAWIVALLAAVNAELAEMMRAETWRAIARSFAHAFMLMFTWLGIGVALAQRARSASLHAKLPSQVLIVQPEIDARVKRARPAHTASLYRDATERALRERRPDWVVWGETAIAGPVDEARLEHVLRVRTGGGFGVPLLTGAIVRSRAGELYNSALSIDAVGHVCAECRYDKQRLVPLAETRTAWLPPYGKQIPFQQSFDTKSGGARPIWIGDHPLAVAICYEALYANDFRRRVSGTGAQLLVSLGSDLWLSSERAKKLHVALLQLRAIEHRKFLIHATVGAASAVIDPRGGVDTAPSVFSEHVKVANIEWLGDQTLWAAVGDWPFVILLAVVALGRALRFVRFGFLFRGPPARPE